MQSFAYTWEPTHSRAQRYTVVQGKKGGWLSPGQRKNAAFVFLCSFIFKNLLNQKL